MDIDQFKEEKKNLEIAIREVVSGAISEFKEKTSYSPSDISIYLCEVTPLEKDKKEYIVCDCEVNVAL